MTLQETHVEVKVETRGHSHVDELRNVLAGAGYDAVFSDANA